MVPALFTLLFAATAAPAPPPPAPPPPPALAHLPGPNAPFRLGLSYMHVLTEDGDLTDNRLATNAVSLDLAFASYTYTRNHLRLGHQWEDRGAYSAKGFRIDLIAIGFPIPLLAGELRLDLEPVLTVLRGEIMFVSGGNALLRVESGFGIELSATFRRWFLGVEPLAVDFRYFAYAADRSYTGFGRIFPFRITIGREF
jgi:hypothetical protein